MNAVARQELDAFTLAYIECALWSSTDESRDDGGDPMNRNYGLADIAPETLAEMAADCKRFQEENAEDISVGPSVHIRSSTDELAGHDFWLNRNGHGCGFWDGDWPEPQASRLDAASKAFGEFNLYVGDDGKIHGSGR